MTSKTKDHNRLLLNLNACLLACEWAKKFSTLEEAWNACVRADWMNWLLSEQIDKSAGTLSAKMDAHGHRVALISERGGWDTHHQPQLCADIRSRYPAAVLQFKDRLWKARP